MVNFNFQKIESKWQKKWEEKNIFKSGENSKKKKFYVLEMFAYPSSYGLHMGHVFNYTIGDIKSRYYRMKGYNVFYPVGYDSLGLPAENAAIKEGIHPRDYTKKSIENFKKQQKIMGWSYDWNTLLDTSDSEYVKWDQWIFLKMFERKLAYKKKAFVNWCNSCKTVLANEQSQKGFCERCREKVEIKELDQWFFKTTFYSEELLKNLENLDWPERIKSMQKNWIGKSNGFEIDFDFDGKKLPIFTTRPDTIYGVTFMVISAQHSRIFDFVKPKQKKDVEKFLKKIGSVSEKQISDLEKEGVFTGSYARNPLTNEKIPIYAGNFVLPDYGSGIVMAVPAHDKRDFDFAKKYKIKINRVIESEKQKELPYIGEGNLINSGKFNGLNNNEAKQKIISFLSEKKLGRKITQYKLKDWLISRQRYWGTPIPIIYCDSCGIVPLREKDLPVILPEKVIFGKGNPLETNNEFLNTKCFLCGGNARRETDTMDTFVNSSWYFLRYVDNKNKKEIFNKEKVDYWLPIDEYIGGAEHACMHLIYSRFYTKFLRDIGLLNFDEPAKKLFNQGMIYGSDGNKMSKSLGNVVDPSKIIEKYGADSLRMFIVSVASLDKDFFWDSKGLESTNKFLFNVKKYFDEVNFERNKKKDKNIEKEKLILEHKLNKFIKEIEENIISFKYNLAIIKIKELFSLFSDKTDLRILEDFLKILNPFCPHITEEIWENLGKKDFLSLQKWPNADIKKINPLFDKEEQILLKLIEDINNIIGILKEKNSKVNNIYLYSLPGEFDLYFSNKSFIEKKIGFKLKINSVSDNKKYDPEKKSKKAKPGKPAIYID